MNGLYSCIIAVSMYSKIPMPNVEWTEERMRYVMCFFPLVGIVQGAALGLWLHLALDVLNLSVGAAALTGAAIPMLVTGGIHMDGFLDTMDAIHSYGDREKKLGHLDLLYVKHGTGCITEINDHLFEGRYSPMWIDGKMKAELAELKKQKAKIGSQPQAREGKKRKKPEQTKKASKRLISRCADNFAHQEMSFLE